MLFELDRLSRSSIHCTVWLTAVSAFVIACDGVLFKSFCTVVNADWAVDRSPELIALPSAFISVESWELLVELPDELLPFAEEGVWFNWL